MADTFWALPVNSIRFLWERSRKSINPSEPLFMRFPEEMLGRRLELLLLSEPDPKSGASANFATRADVDTCILQIAGAWAMADI